MSHQPSCDLMESQNFSNSECLVIIPWVPDVKKKANTQSEQYVMVRYCQDKFKDCEMKRNNP